MVDTRSVIEDHVTCSICMDLYQDPVALPCMHSFCRRCLFGIYTSAMILKCPECRKDTKIGNSGIDSLPRNFQLGSIVDIYKKEHKVVPLPKLPVCAEHKTECEILCETCKHSICLSCISTQNHSGHKLGVATERRTASNQEGKPQCENHSREASLYCKDCDMLICLECFITTHKDHLPQSVAVVYAHIVDTLEATLGDLDTRQRLLRATQKSCRTMAQKVQADAQRKNRELSVFFIRLRETLDSKEASMKHEIDRKEKDAVETYLAKAEQAAKKEQILNEVINDVKKLQTKDKKGLFKDQKKATERANMLLDNEVKDSMPRVKGLDGVSLQTCSLHEPLSNVKWHWPDNGIRVCQFLLDPDYSQYLPNFYKACVKN